MVSINPRTGYKNEAWHIRYLGVEDATAFHQAFAATAGTVDEVTLEQWLRKKHGLVAPETELPVCDGCRCGACSTLAAPGSKDAVCTGGALFLDEQGRVQKAPTGAHLGEITVVRKGDVLELTIAATLDPLVVTQPPLATSGHSVQYSSGEDYMHARPLADLLPRPYRERPGAIRVGVGIAGDTTFPYRAALTTNTVAEVWGRENVLLPTFLGPVTVRMEIPAPPRPTKLTVALVHDGTHYDARDISY